MTFLQSLVWKFSSLFRCENTTLRMRHRKCLKIKLKYFFHSSRELSNQLKENLTREHVKNIIKKQQAQREAKAFNTDFIISVLNSSATKREARSYIQRFAPPDTVHPLNGAVKKRSQKLLNCNLERIYEPAAILDSPKFIQKPAQTIEAVKETQRHLAVVKIRAIQDLSNQTIDGIGRTIYQLSRLGLTSIVVLDFNSERAPVSNFVKRDINRKKLEAEQSNRIVNAINLNGEIVARLVDNIIGVKTNLSSPEPNQDIRTFVAFPELLAIQLRRDIIAVIPPIGYTDSTQNSLTVPANEVVLALSRELVRVSLNRQPNGDLKGSLNQRQHALSDENLLDRLILLDPLGGIPTPSLSHGYHVYLNMVDEYDEVRQVLFQNLYRSSDKHELEASVDILKTSGIDNKISVLRSSDSWSKASQIHSEPREQRNNLEPKPEKHFHLENLELARKVLSILPSSSSALMIGPEEVANSTRDTSHKPDLVGTRRQRNPLIHNLLTDKSVFSSSLPSGRRRKQANSGQYGTNLDDVTVPITFAKHGIPVTIFPDPKIAPWTPETGLSKMSLTNSEIDLPLLVNLINDSFGRTLDVPAYLARVESRIAGVIVAGEYEGGAILTWETPPGLDPTDTSCMIPYLDKFAVLQRSQGSGGVADLIFNCIVRKCFPHGVVWRSRKNNPVNKWYFERSRGTWELSETGWVMFWTTPNVTLNQRPLLLDYERVCRSIQPTWQTSQDKVR